MITIGTSGFRGIVGKDFDEKVVQKIAFATVQLAKENNFGKKIIVGYDNRTSSKKFAKIFCQVLAFYDIKTTFCRASVPSPLIALMTKKKDFDIGIMVTASHNPFVYNGIKIFIDGKDLDTKYEKFINTAVNSANDIKSVKYLSAKLQGKIDSKNFTKYYCDSLTSKTNLQGNNITSLFDTFGGSSKRAINYLSKKYKLKTTIIDSLQLSKKTIPAPLPSGDNLKYFLSCFKQKHYDFGFATDGDGDRVTVLDEQGEIVDGNLLAGIIYYYLATKNSSKQPFVVNASFSVLGELVCKTLKTKCVRTKVGFKNISNMLTKQNGLVGAENSGMAIALHLPTKDALIVYATLLEMLNYYHQPLSQIIKKFRNKISYNLYYKELSFDYSGDEGKLQTFLSTYKPTIKGKTIAQSDTLDGYKYIFDDSTFLMIRLSGTEKVIRFVSNDKTEKFCINIINKTKLEIANKLKSKISFKGD